ncbi:MAG TPA: serine/threonine-protein kinase [Polyangiaceae bacterium]|nr:serine/threonine-protein kinase [Polyangiaceae bacterium]
MSEPGPGAKFHPASSVFDISGNRPTYDDLSPAPLLAGRYRLMERLGAGGMGSVWRADDLNLDAEIAIKLIDPELAQSPEAVARFRREAQAAASIRSTYVVQILDYGIDQGIPFIAMELLRGESLAKRLRREKRLSPEQVVHILGHVGRALALAHDHGIVHRDLKPDNVFLVREGDEDIGKLVDFGIARRPEGLDQAADLKTSTGALLGTPFYMSPEQATGQVADHQTDIWSFGAIAFECLTGERPFRGESLGALFHSICMGDIPVPSRVAPVPDGFDDWFARATARDKARRFSTIKEAAEQLRIVCGGGVSSTRFARTRESVPPPHHASPIAPVSSRPYEVTAPPAAQTLMGMGASRWTFPVFILTLTASVASASGLAVWVALRGNSGGVPDASVVATVTHDANSGVSKIEPRIAPPESKAAMTPFTVSVVPVFPPADDQLADGSAQHRLTQRLEPAALNAPAAVAPPSTAMPTATPASSEPRMSVLREAINSSKPSSSGLEAAPRKPSSVPVGDNAAGI